MKPETILIVSMLMTIIIILGAFFLIGDPADDLKACQKMHSLDVCLHELNQ